LDFSFDLAGRPVNQIRARSPSTNRSSPAKNAVTATLQSL
jgi:hypothetical protein